MAEWTRKSMYGVYSLSFEVPKTEGGNFTLMVNGKIVHEGTDPARAHYELHKAFPRGKFGVVARRRIPA